jgi:hypothetical protein
MSVIYEINNLALKLARESVQKVLNPSARIKASSASGITASCSV